MALLDRVKARTGSDLPDDELEAMIAGIVAEIDARFGPAGPIRITLGDLSDPNSRYRRTLRLIRPMDPGEPVTIVESDPGNSGDAGAEVTLDPADWRAQHGGRTLQRLTAGPNGRSWWAPLVTVTYTPVGEQAARDEALIKIMQLDLSYRGGLKSERAGDYQFTLADNVTAERERIFEGLAQRRGMVMA
ncbi:hypothetical protein [Sphingobium lignivorans]|uniref:Phage gp6-like head-tail connector protein n=1 Tax=Sphingobium lignivorans TaxID=2735886 RepID=A0ABR6NL79_9SPHN|nr:hypothetical protein [Sphingobium lignivorans]MBB5987427.1 hypothetical protein [Sphingobium lignivorans]